MDFIGRHRLGLFVVFAMAVLALALWEARGALPAFGIAIALAFLLDPPVTALQRFGVHRVVGILLVYMVVVVAVVGLGVLLLPPLVAQFTLFLEELPTLAAQLIRWVEAIVDWLTGLPLPDPIADAIDSIIESGQQALVALLEAIVGPALGLIARTAAFVAGLVIIPVWLLFVLKDRERLPDGVLGLLPSGWRRDASHVMSVTVNLIGRWIRGQLLLGLVIFGATLIGLLGLAAIGFTEFASFAVLLAIVAGVLEWVPVIGPIIAAVPAILIGASISPGAALAAVALYTVIQQLENNFLVPKVMGDAVDLHPSVVLVGLIVGASLFGIWGAVLAAPVVALGRDLYRYTFRRLEGGSTDEARAYADRPRPSRPKPPPEASLPPEAEAA